MRSGVLGALAVAAALVMTTGCQRLKWSKKTSVAASSVKEFIFTAPAYEQKLRVTVTPTGGSVSAYLVKKDDAGSVERHLQADKEPPASLLLGSRVSRGNPEAYSFDATVPAKTEYSLLLRSSGRPADVLLNVDGR